MATDQKDSPIWVTGAGGFIGQHLCHNLALKEKTVIGFGFRQFAIAKGHYFGGGLSSEILNNAVSKFGKPAAVYHLAGGSTVGQSIVEPSQDFNRSVASTSILLNFLKNVAREVPVVLASSAAVYGAGHQGPISISATLNPFSPYGFHKRMVEELGQSFHATYGQPISIVRLFSVYGEGLRKQLLWDLCNKMRNDETQIILGGSGQEVRDWCHVSDVVQLLKHACANNSNGLRYYNGGTGIATPIHRIADSVMTFWGGELSIKFSNKSRLGDPVSLIADTNFLPEGQEWAIDINEGIRRYVAWFKGLPLI